MGDYLDYLDLFARDVFDAKRIRDQRGASEFSHGPGRVVPWVESRARAQHRMPEPSDGYGTPYFAKTPPQETPRPDPRVTVGSGRKYP